MNELTWTEQHNMAIGLDILLQAQFELQINAYGLDPSKLEGEALADFIRWNAYALEDELHEATAETGWKPWATSRHINKEAFTRELVDLLHFFANLCLAAGIDGNALSTLYTEKRNRNLERQREGYDGLSGKCPNCGRDFKEGYCVLEAAGRYICQEWLAEARLPEENR